MENFLNDAFDTFGHYTAEAPNVWVTVYSDPMTKNSMLHAGEGPPEEQWHLVESTIYKNLKFYKRFIIRVARPAKEASNVKNAQAIQIKVVYDPTQVQQPAAVAGIGSLYPPADIGRLLDERDEKWKKELEHRDALRERDDKIAALEYDNRQRKKKGDVLEQVGQFCEQQGIDLNPIIQGLISKLPLLFSRTSGAMQAAPGVAGGRQFRPQGTAIHEHPSPANVPTHETPDGTEDETDQEPYELTEEDNQALDALDILRNAGAKNPADILLKVANFYASDPAKAEGYLNFLQ